jgi:transcription termination/antitermination protein NusG
MEHTVLESNQKSTSKWYIVRTQANRERSVSEKIIKSGEKGELLGKIQQVIVPMEKTFYIKADKKVKREKVLYPGYIFIQSNAVGELKYFLKECNGATGFLTNKSGEIQALSQNEVNRMIGYVEEAEKEIENPFIAGEEVKILDGPFQSMVGTIEKIEGQRVKVAVSIFGRKTPIELDVMQIDKK